MGTFAVATALLMATCKLRVQGKRLQWWNPIVFGQLALVTKLLSVEGGSESHLL